MRVWTVTKTLRRDDPARGYGWRFGIELFRSDMVGRWFGVFGRTRKTLRGRLLANLRSARLTGEERDALRVGVRGWKE